MVGGGDEPGDVAGDDELPFEPGGVDGIAVGLEGGRDCVALSWEWMRNATLSKATVNTTSKPKRIASIRKPAPCTDKLHHSDVAETKIIRLRRRSCRTRLGRARHSAVAAYALRK